VPRLAHGATEHLIGGIVVDETFGLAIPFEWTLGRDAHAGEVAERGGKMPVFNRGGLRGSIADGIDKVDEVVVVHASDPAR